ncbi:MAG: sterol desaturase family protein [Cytophagaceae bacterium]|jgi:sterol desaturase/sphingolipid hydroxylase (fatty acid hydroxylase superfamily)|nr:sterol desaturase family protein [Cytophagaceae bacterium]
MEITLAVFSKLLTINLIRYFVIAGIPFLLFYIAYKKKCSGLKIQTKDSTWKDFMFEISHSLQSTVLFVAISMAIVFSPLADYTQLYEQADQYAWWWSPISIVLAIVLHDTYFYWMHRTMHHPRIYRYVHLVHHKSTNPSPWASYSFHWLEAIIEGLVILPIVFLIPMHLSTLGVFITLSFMINVYGHLGYEIVPSWIRSTWIFSFFNTSVYHNMHHSHVKGNYSLYFRHWDKWMKTENKGYENYFDKVMEQRGVIRPEKRIEKSADSI